MRAWQETTGWSLFYRFGIDNFKGARTVLDCLFIPFLNKWGPPLRIQINWVRDWVIKKSWLSIRSPRMRMAKNRKISTQRLSRDPGTNLVGPRFGERRVHTSSMHLHPIRALKYGIKYLLWDYHCMLIANLNVDFVTLLLFCLDPSLKWRPLALVRVCDNSACILPIDCL